MKEKRRVLCERGSLSSRNRCAEGSFGCDICARRMVSSEHLQIEIGSRRTIPAETSPVPTAEEPCEARVVEAWSLIHAHQDSLFEHASPVRPSSTLGPRRLQKPLTLNVFCRCGSPDTKQHHVMPLRLRTCGFCASADCLTSAKAVRSQTIETENGNIKQLRSLRGPT